ncbi:MAG: 30S ribosomal protein S20 [Candidatus Omnitrophica bacterium]|nr:30S ribosomal protein S20 [bacterium]NUN97534.1 30S ribosomal protein S20 [Candidatus Omnitrophota bacterium]
MAHHKSAIKRLKTNEKSRVRNHSAKSRCRTLEKNLRAAVQSGKKNEAETQLQVVQKALDQARSHGILKAETVSRKKGRLMKLVNQLTA